MHRTIKLLMVSFCAALTFGAYAQGPVAETSKVENLSAAERWIVRHPDKALIALIVLSLVVIGYLFYKFIFIPALGKRRSDGLRDEDEQNTLKNGKSASSLTPYVFDKSESRDQESSLTSGVSASPLEKRDFHNGNEKDANSSAQVSRTQSRPLTVPEPSTIESVKTPERSIALKETFYMTVPNSNGTFSIHARKKNPQDCLYEFEVDGNEPKKASFTFFGGESAMKKAQAFREEQLLPAIEFLNQPNLNTFKIADQKVGLAVLEGDVWRIENKIKIEFQP